MDDDGDMAAMFLSEKKLREEEVPGIARQTSTWTIQERDFYAPKSSLISPSSSSSRLNLLEKVSSLRSSCSAINIEELEMMLEAYFVVVDYSLSNLLSVSQHQLLAWHPGFLVMLIFSSDAIFLCQLKEYIDDTEDFINIKLVRKIVSVKNFNCLINFVGYECQDNIQNQLIQFGLLLSGATFVVTAFAVVTGVFGMNFADPVFDLPSHFDSALISAGICCGSIYIIFLLYVKHRKLLRL